MRYSFVNSYFFFKLSCIENAGFNTFSVREVPGLRVPAYSNNQTYVA